MEPAESPTAHSRQSRQPIPDSHQLEQIAENSASLLRFVKRRERGRGGPATAGGEGRGWLPRVHAPLGEGRGRDHAELRRARPGFRESEIDGMNGEGGQLSRRLGGRLRCRAASGGRGRRRNRSAQTARPIAERNTRPNDSIPHSQPSAASPNRCKTGKASAADARNPARWPDRPPTKTPAARTGQRNDTPPRWRSRRSICGQTRPSPAPLPLNVHEFTSPSRPRRKTIFSRPRCNQPEGDCLGSLCIKVETLFDPEAFIEYLFGNLLLGAPLTAAESILPIRYR